MKMGKKLYHGAAWYPELWDQSVIEQDILLMKQAGMNVVRIGEFAWSNMEPTEGNIDLGLFVRWCSLLHENGIRYGYVYTDAHASNLVHARSS